MGKLTIVELRNLKPEDHGRKLSDGDSVVGKVISGKTGISVAFALRYKFDSKGRELALGTWKATGGKAITDIRKSADKARAILNTGRDPAAEKILQKHTERQQQLDHLAQIETAQRQELTFGRLVYDWVAIDRAKRVKDGGAEVLRSFGKDLLPTFGQTPVKDITRGMILRELDRVRARTPSVARGLLADMRVMFKWAILSEMVDNDPTHLLELKKFGGKNERERFLSEDEIRHLFTKALPTARLTHHHEQAIRIMLATACRVGEISSARWADVDTESAIWTIPASNSKNGKAHRIHLSAYALAAFEAIRTDQGKKRQEWGRPHLPAYILPSKDWTTHIDLKAIAKQTKDRQRSKALAGRVKDVDKALSLPGGDWTPHDLRRTGATLMRALGADSDVIERCLNHSKKETLKRIYQRPDWTTQMRDAWVLLGDRLALLSTKHDNVVILKTGT